MAIPSRMQFVDLATIAGSEVVDRGTKFIAADGAWLVLVSDKSAHEWVIWQRALPGDRRAQVRGYVRRVPWMRFAGDTGCAQAMLIAGVLDDLPATASLEVFRHAAHDALRDAKTGLAFRVVSAVASLAKAARRDVEAHEDDLMRDV